MTLSIFLTSQKSEKLAKLLALVQVLCCGETPRPQQRLNGNIQLVLAYRPEVYSSNTMARSTAVCRETCAGEVAEGFSSGLSDCRERGTVGLA